MGSYHKGRYRRERIRHIGRFLKCKGNKRWRKDAAGVIIEGLSEDVPVVFRQMDKKQER